MKHAALTVFVCPRCKGSLRVDVSRQEGAEIVDGRLTCQACDATYSVSDGVPRFVNRGAYASSFGRQWHWFRTVQLDSHTGQDHSARAFRGSTGWSDEDVRGRLVLDAGVGAGRFAECAANAGGVVFGVDLTSAVDAAYENIGRRENVHLAQADIFALPFRDGQFDRAYSIGVLHHTPNPPDAFAHVARTVKPEGQFAVYLYARYGPDHHATDLIRRVTTRLPVRAVLAASTVAIPLYYLYRVPGLRRVLPMVLPLSTFPNWKWRWLDTFDWYSPRYQFKYLYPEVFRWFRANGFGELELFDEPIRMRGTRLPLSQPDAAESQSFARVVAS
jgi:SAM-dependent methyltransferase